MTDQNGPSDFEIDESLIRVNALKPIDIISLLMQVRVSLDGIDNIVTDPGRLRWLKDVILSNCQLMAKMDKEYPDKNDVVQMLALFILEISEMPVGNTTGNQTLN